MAICDMLTVIFPAPGLWYMYTFGNHYKPLHPVSMCLAYSIFNEVSQQRRQTFVQWATYCYTQRNCMPTYYKKKKKTIHNVA